MATAVQILCVVAYKGPGWTNSQIVAGNSLRTNPVVVRRLLKAMQHHGLVEIRSGKDGGVRLARPAEQITLDQIYEAVEADAGVFALRPAGNPKCPVDSKMKGLLGPIFDTADKAVVGTLRQTCLASLVSAIA